MLQLKRLWNVMTLILYTAHSFHNLHIFTIKNVYCGNSELRSGWLCSPVGADNSAVLWDSSSALGVRDGRNLDHNVNI